VFSRNFVSIKIDAEKGEGKELAKRFGVSAFPTMFFINPQTGRALHRMMGFMNVEEILDEVRQFEQSGKYGGLEQMRADFREGRSDVEFLVDFFKFLPANDHMRSAIAERYLLNVPAETFKSENEDIINFISGENSILNALTSWNDKVMARLIDLLEEKKREDDGRFSAGYNIGVVFGVELTGGRFMQMAIDSGDEEMLEQTIEFQQNFRRRLDRWMNGDGDATLHRGRRIFFASPQFIRLEFLAANRKDPERFKREVIPFMNNLMAEMPADSVAAKVGESIALHTQNSSLPPGFADILVTNAIRANGVSTDAIIKWANYYWRLMPSDRRTKETVAKWLNYAVAINPYSASAAKGAAPLLAKVGRTKDAIKNLERVLEIYRKLGLEPSKHTNGIQDLIDDIKNDKI
jgi:hypothetical protein